MTLRWDLTEDDVYDEVRTILADLGGTCPSVSCRIGAKTVLIIDIDEAATEIARKLVAS